MGSGKKRTLDEGTNAAGGRTVSVHNAKVHRKPRKAASTGEDLLEREKAGVKRETSNVKRKKDKSNKKKIKTINIKNNNKRKKN